MITKIETDFKALANKGIRDLIPYQPGKSMAELERELGISASIKLASNENPLGPSPSAMLIAQAAFQHAHIYPDSSYFEFKQALSSFLNIQPAQITVGNGSENILELIIKAYLHQATNAIISEYAFLSIPILINGYNIPLKIIPATHWGHDVNAMLAAIDDETRILFLINPNNPTGTYINADDFQILMKNVPPQVLVVVDEAYHEYAIGIDYPNTLDCLAAYPNLIITRTFSKAYGLAGLRIGYAISSSTISDILNRARMPFNVNSIAAKAACAALLDEDHLQKTLALNTLGKEQLEQGFQSLHLNYIKSVCNFITVEVPDALALYQSLLYEGVIVRPLHTYQMPKHIRVSIGTYKQNERFLSAMKKCCSIS